MEIQFTYLPIQLISRKSLLRARHSPNIAFSIGEQIDAVPPIMKLAVWCNTSKHGPILAYECVYIYKYLVSIRFSGSQEKQ